MNEHRTYPFAERNGHPLEADVYLPQDRPRAAVLYFHGGGGVMGSRRDILGLHSLLEGGCAVISADYRLAPEVRLPEILQDAADAYHWLLREGEALLGLDVSRLALAGFSFGGYMVQQLGTMLSPSPRCIVSISGYGELMDAMYLRPSEYYCASEPMVSPEAAHAAIRPAPTPDGSAEDRWRLYLYTRQRPAWLQIVVGTDAAEAVEPYSPARHLTADYPPICLVHGLSDEDVPYRQSAAMAQQLMERRLPYRLITLRGGHGVAEDESKEAWEQILAFMKAHLE